MKLTIMLIAAIRADCSQANMDLAQLTRELIACCTPLAGTVAMKQISYNLLARPGAQHPSKPRAQSAGKHTPSVLKELCNKMKLTATLQAELI